MSKTTNASDKFILRLPDGMRDQLKAAAKINGRTMNAEVVSRLSSQGKELRDEFASAALTGMLIKPEAHSMIKDDHSAAAFCFRMADAMLAAREGGAR